MVQEPIPVLSHQAKLQALLETQSELDSVYFEPPPNLLMQYPCIVYELDSAETLYADNVPYRRTKRWQVTVIEREPDSNLPDKIADLPLSHHDRRFVADNLIHDVFTLFF